MRPSIEINSLAARLMAWAVIATVPISAGPRIAAWSETPPKAPDGVAQFRARTGCLRASIAAGSSSRLEITRSAPSSSAGTVV